MPATLDVAGFYLLYNNDGNSADWRCVMVTNELADNIRVELERRGETLESMLTTMREEREKYAVKPKNS